MTPPSPSSRDGGTRITQKVITLKRGRDIELKEPVWKGRQKARVGEEAKSTALFKEEDEGSEDEDEDEERGGDAREGDGEGESGRSDNEEEQAEAPASPMGSADIDGQDAGAVEGKVYFVLQKAALEVAKIGKTYQLLNCDDHVGFLKKHKRDPALYRPDILHQALLAILDSPLNKAGRLAGLYVESDKNVLIQVNPHVRIPRTFRRFCGLMVQLLQKLSIRASNGPEKLLRCVKQPVTKYLPASCRRIGMSHSAPRVVELRSYVKAASNVPLVFVVGAFAHGQINTTWVDDTVSVSEYALSAACCLGRICNALELKWNIL
eukprot:TRINITY_DN14980_c0_g1_i1.p1 TRINITY_DN14980_c0_g1~~TRINITY_DN14980_c0_g1_i1.p1  ORF type:complete len:321 (-),score=76.51 TRINITY_DN14980_c0_g1_i1:970-1932(-)